MWTVLVISTFFQVLAMFGIGQNNAIALEAGKADKVYALWPMIAVTSLLVVGVILFICLRKRPFIGLIVAAVAGLNILFNLPVAVRRLHDSSLSGKFILIPILIFIVTFLLIFLLRLIPEDMTPYLGYLGMASSLMDLFSILFLSMMLLKSSPGPNEYGVLPQKITVS